MQFSTIFLTLAAVAGFVAANPTGQKNGNCATGQLQCCSQVTQGKEAEEALAGLGLALNEALTGAIGLNCDSVPFLIGVTVQDQCKNTPVCCEGSANNGLIQTSCTALPIV
ncbi:uncharacterized protein PFL1_01606 [Pseudozyma flocculosa PF-1]|uniref:Hydrophobin n=1 Tax=Pseudozyma flocculosa TaxID=84751 RepID=A0A5C3F0Z7_9BASI|nr:uncharacterized protein PFL1_01606 [Pseudozyma flocculosa PF-1]EPQ30705.1 hypothetical protein PFL1_01606 [Pseudozyma flocculosa PF-1]SPO36951.1 related to hydrophobin 2 [Pseudozyma flocculosa]